MSITVTSRAAEAMHRAARAAHPREACGILLGEGGRIVDLLETANVHSDPLSHFEIDPQALIDAHRAARDGGPDVLGYFHSHPGGLARPSATDSEMACGDGRVWAIWGEGSLAFFRAGKAGFEALSTAMIDG